MTKIDYLYELQKRLKNLPEEDRAEIIEAFEEHFAEGKKAGKTDAEIMEELGTADEVAESLGAVPEKEVRTGTWKDYLNETLRFVKDTLNSVKDSRGINFNFEFDSSADDFKPRAEDLTGYLEEDVQEVYVQSDGPLDLKLRKGDTLNYIFRSGSGGVETSSENGKAYIRILGASRREEPEMCLEIPESVCILDVRMPSGTVYAEEITPDTFSVSGSSADANIRNIESKAFRFSSNSGDLSMADVTFEKAFVNTVSGDIDINRINADLDIRTVSGDLELAETVSDEVYLESKSGDISYKGETEVFGAESISGDLEVRITCHAGQVIAKTVSGDVNLCLADEDFRADIVTVSGDISDETGSAMRRRGIGIYETGNGNAEVQIKTVSGDITLETE